MAERSNPDDDGVELGPAPGVLGRERIRAAARAKLFGGAVPSRDATEVQPESRGSSTKDAEEPTTIGRFRVLERLGAGGMGVVYSAYDPELDRKIALKLLRPEIGGGSTGSVGGSRLQREAQAMARLNHPNVATVHEVGREGERIFVAMEYVAGGTLRDWLNDQRSQREILEKFVDAGTGLAAAHAAGIVHRDFKPDNVMIDEGGRVRVLDFGLSRSSGSAKASTAPIPAAKSAARASDEVEIDAFSSPLTATGAIMGTPAYMAPEQHLGQDVSATADQFAFCVSVWEALVAERPFAGQRYPELFTAVTTGQISAVPSSVRIPSGVLNALRRGLSVDPNDRFESMEPLLEALRPRRPSWRRWVGAGLVVVVGASALTYWAAARSGDPTEACAHVSRQLDGVWDDQRRDQVAAALQSSGAPYAGTVWSTTRRMLDAYAQAWTAASGELCAARVVTDDPDAEVLLRRERCLEARRSELEHFVALLARDEEGVALSAVQAAATLSEISACSDSRRLEAWSAPRDEESRERLADARSQLGLAKVQGMLGRYEEAISIADAVVEAGRELDDPATQAAGLQVRGQYEERTGDLAQAEKSLRLAVERAEVAGDHASRAVSLIHLVYVVGKAQRRFDEAKALAADAGAVLRVIGADPVLEAKLATNLGSAAREAGELDVALAHYRTALDGYLEHYAESHPEAARALTNIGSVLVSQGKTNEADEILHRALTSFEASLGPEHPFVGVVVNNLGTSLGSAFRHQEALPWLERGLEIRRKTLGRDHRLVAQSLFNLGSARFAVGQYAAAEGDLKEAVEMLERLDPADPRIPAFYVNLGAAIALQGEKRRDEAVSILEPLLLEFPLPTAKAEAPARTLRVQLASLWAVSDPARARALAIEALDSLDADQEAHPGEDTDRVRILKGIVWLIDSRAEMERYSAGGKQ